MGHRLLFADDAAIFLHQLAKGDGLKWRRSIVWLLNENCRDPLSPSALDRGKFRGNRRKWGEIPFHRLGTRKVYREYDLENWYETTAKPLLEAEDSAVKAGARPRRTAVPAPARLS